MKEKTIVSTVTLAASLGAYFYAKSAQKDAVPYVMVAGVVGAMLGEVIVKMLDKPKKD